MSKSPVKVKAGEVKKEEKKEEPLEEGACPHCRKKHIDLTSMMTFQNQKDSTGCARTSKAIIEGTTVMINKTIHKVIHQVKSWIRGIYSWVSEFNIDRYLAEYSFRINRSQNKDTIFNKLIKRLIERKPIFQPQLVCS